MAINLSNFVQDQIDTVQTTLNPANVIERVTPSQVKDLLNANPVNEINDMLGNISGVKISQEFNNITSQLTDQVKGFVNGSIDQLEAQVLGCINKAIKDFLDENPIIDNILNFDNFINRELSKIKNKLESKIDKELRKLVYKKIKIQQVAIFKQKIAFSIKKICPDASPATPGQIRQYKDAFGKLVDSVSDVGKVVEDAVGENLPIGSVSNTVAVTETIQEKTKPTEISNTLKRQLKTDPDKKEEVKQEVLTETVNQLQSQALKQAQGENCETWSSIYG